jgi:hypothetical protein
MYLDFKDFLSNYLHLSDFKILEDEKFFYLWKKEAIPSSF